VTFLIYMALPTLFIAFLATWLFTPIVRRISDRFSIYDHPSERKLHREATPLLGGIALFLGVSLSLISHVPFNSTLFTVLVGALAATLLGMWDDVWGAKPISKLIWQIAIAAFTVKMGISIHFVTHPVGAGVLPLYWLSTPLTILWLVGVMNTFNLLDGLDGLASGIAAISGLFLSIVSIQSGNHIAAVFCLAIVGASLGFLRFNFSPAQIFMGDSGSMFLGYMIGVVSVIGVMKSTLVISLFIPILVLGIPLSDTAFTVIRRLKNKQALFKPDRGHLHHRLVGKGLSDVKATLLMYALSAILGLCAVTLNIPGKLGNILAGGILFATIAICVGLLKKISPQN
jgi:UDP-GlcNAc:undecaprenyl-phosphate/decaprenyl-phosphate GlcNAc-1-phosphate transferase